ncbi:rRNA maturation RNase YbeY [Maribacter algarum]|uniref:Endoribonuclease YbeY n=1 Tax=Maribacter algarum (ex Zhang et al. 2020) TaxID=2578118 RepID=A0A5S3Q061_9FLAO|nr:rRNA maturation RNase YbeY [Maribacter algarum]TMM58977.1 rRNA maturation RNase YbeY [Maribacter algarum]
MINFNYLTDYQIVKEELYSQWLLEVIGSENRALGDIAYVFCDDAYLLKVNQEYLKHDTYTDIITFDYTDGNTMAGDIFISLDRVKENAAEFKVDFDEELRRVMAHGILHLSGYGDKSDKEAKVMRAKEEEKMKLFHVEQKN